MSKEIMKPEQMNLKLYDSVDCSRYLYYKYPQEMAHKLHELIYEDSNGNGSMKSISEEDQCDYYTGELEEEEKILFDEFGEGTVGKRTATFYVWW